VGVEIHSHGFGSLIVMNSVAPIECSAVLAYMPPHIHSLEIESHIIRSEVPSSESYNLNLHLILIR
jgi:hypothetical protein